MTDVWGIEGSPENPDSPPDWRRILIAHPSKPMDSTGASAVTT